MDDTDRFVALVRAARDCDLDLYSRAVVMTAADLLSRTPKLADAWAKALTDMASSAAIEAESTSPIVVIDPTGCGCTDCIAGVSEPFSRFSDKQILAIAEGRHIDRTGGEIAWVKRDVRDVQYGDIPQPGGAS